MALDYMELTDTIVKVITFILCTVVVIIILVAIIKIWRNSNTASFVASFMASLFH